LSECGFPAVLALDLHGLRPDEVAIWAAAVEGGSELASLRADAGQPGFHHETDHQLDCT
jgi:hypothetical protein